MPPRSPGTSALRTSAPAATLAALLTTTGVAHLAVPAPFDAIVPRSLPGTPRFWTVASGVAELVVAAAVAAPRTRRLGAAAAAGLFVGVFPANVKMARDWSHRSPAARAVVWGRLPLQIPLVAWALAVRRRSRV
jgi:uncharacterized membrane protein